MSLSLQFDIVESFKSITEDLQNWQDNKTNGSMSILEDKQRYVMQISE